MYADIHSYAHIQRSSDPEGLRPPWLLGPGASSRELTERRNTHTHTHPKRDLAYDCNDDDDDDASAASVE